MTLYLFTVDKDISLYKKYNLFGKKKSLISYAQIILELLSLKFSVYIEPLEIKQIFLHGKKQSSARCRLLLPFIGLWRSEALLVCILRKEEIPGEIMALQCCIDSVSFAAVNTSKHWKENISDFIKYFF